MEENQSFFKRFFEPVVVGVPLVVFEIITNLKDIPPETQIYGVLVVFAICMAFIIFARYFEYKKDLQKMEVDAGVEKQKSWNESTRSPVEAERARIETMAKQLAIMVAYRGIISVFEESAKDENRSKEERAFYEGAVKRLKDMEKAVSIP